MELGQEMNFDAYLERISIVRAHRFGLNLESLQLLQTRHLLNVPFENLDIHWKRPITLDVEKFYETIVGENRGGFCYELNGLFNELLKSLGFQTRLISARVSKGGIPGPEYDHAAIIATLGEQEYLVDVGFGEFVSQPLAFVLDRKQNDVTGDFVIRKFDEEYFEVAKRDGDNCIGEYIFKDVPRELSEFREMCDFQQYSPESHFTKGKLCSILTETGRKTLTDTKFIVSRSGVKDEAAVSSPEEFEQLLADEFKIRRLQ